MKSNLIYLVLSIVTLVVVACTSKSDSKNQSNRVTQNLEGVSEIDFTPKTQNKIKSLILKQSKDLTIKLKKESYTSNHVDFCIDTFKVFEYSRRKMGYFSSTIGMSETTSEETNKVDSLMNKYYNRLLNLLSNEDQIQLKEAQRAWLSFRDKEIKLIGTLRDPRYSGGGTIQSNIYCGLKNQLYKDRLISIFNHLDGIYIFE
jgi:uncharacterized protein YecT (DUF1311 family)